MDMEELVRRTLAGKDKKQLEKLTESGAGAQLASRFDGAAVEKAAREGDMKTLSAMLQKILATPEGREFAQQVKEAADGHGR